MSDVDIQRAKQLRATVSEIFHNRGPCQEAVDLVHEAIRIDPDQIGQYASIAALLFEFIDKRRGEDGIEDDEMWVLSGEALLSLSTYASVAGETTKAHWDLKNRLASMNKDSRNRYRGSRGHGIQCKKGERMC